MRESLARVAAMFLSVGLGGLALLLIAGLALRGREALFARRPSAAVALVALAMGTGAMFYLWAFTSLLPQIPRDPILLGVFAGLAFGGIAVAIVAPVVLLMLLVDPGFRLRIPDPRLSLWMTLAGIVGCAVSGILLVQMFGLMRRSDALALFLVPFGVALFPLVRQLFWAPALLAGLRRRQRTLEPPCAADLRAWADHLAATYRLGKLDVLFGPPKLVNAAAIGFWPFTRFIMIGDGLTADMTARELRAILAHEIAHVLRGDARNQLLLWIALGTVWIYVWTAVSMTAGLRGPMWALASGLGWGAVMLLAGRYSRGCELAADRLAAELLESPADMRDALTRLTSLTKFPASRRSPTHPSVDERLASLG